MPFFWLIYLLYQPYTSSSYHTYGSYLVAVPHCHAFVLPPTPQLFPLTLPCAPFAVQVVTFPHTYLHTPPLPHVAVPLTHRLFPLFLFFVFGDWFETFLPLAHALFIYLYYSWLPPCLPWIYLLVGPLEFTFPHTHFGSLRLFLVYFTLHRCLTLPSPLHTPFAFLLPCTLPHTHTRFFILFIAFICCYLYLCCWFFGFLPSGFFTHTFTFGSPYPTHFGSLLVRSLPLLLPLFPTRLPHTTVRFTTRTHTTLGSYLFTLQFTPHTLPTFARFPLLIGYFHLWKGLFLPFTHIWFALQFFTFLPCPFYLQYLTLVPFLPYPLLLLPPPFPFLPFICLGSSPPYLTPFYLLFILWFATHTFPLLPLCPHTHHTLPSPHTHLYTLLLFSSLGSPLPTVPLSPHLLCYLYTTYSLPFGFVYLVLLCPCNMPFLPLDIPSFPLPSPLHIGFYLPPCYTHHTHTHTYFTFALPTHLHTYVGYLYTPFCLLLHAFLPLLPPVPFYAFAHTHTHATCLCHACHTHTTTATIPFCAIYTHTHSSACTCALPCYVVPCTLPFGMDPPPFICVFALYFLY